MVFATATSGPVISAWAAVSPLGLHGADFATGLRSGRRAGKPLDPEEWSVPFHEACLVPDFHIKQILGRKGTRSMDRATGLAVTAIGQLLTDERPGPAAERPGAAAAVGGRAGGERAAGARLSGVGEETGVALGTSTGSAQSIMDFTRDSLVGERPFFVDPARFPNTVMNCAAGQTAIWHGFKGPNTTVAGGRATGLLTLQYALRLQRAGRATTVLCGAVEEFSSARAWLEWHSRADGDTAAVLGEGAAVWLLEPDATAREHGRGGLAEVVGLEFGFATGPERARTVLADVVRRLLDRTDARPGRIWAVADSQAPGAEGEAERAALAEVLDGHDPLRISAADSIGDTYAASAAFQITAVLALAERPDTAPGSLALVTSVDRDGVVGAALLRTRPQATT
ncbi:beta-ketoacyl synthase N-terminal-like domain-containing protein [Streptomyces sp. ME19-01-6]|uniref:beta-ketoacyl synthase N-terminal-like domain-containing protein n=1 Tax=Streptomyces sp. ME19-01-6 TaxID=3028686 RepID=UPI0029BB384F|nr:beta-ketoacyl synthase N-terminal-like domain-containing protein [Streptomyces sp. ME19-01-6]MDX3233770.1 beta-ketoacyl synthase N-terminal-like domain-containing protein [Streptomyces sp. ME19-01-6]